MSTDSKSTFSSILLSDLAGFTDLSRKMTAADLYKLLENYFSIMESIIKSRNGEFIKTLGDGILCHFPSNEYISRKDAIVNSILAAFDMKRASAYLNTDRTMSDNKEILPEINLRTSIHAGTIRVGPVLGENLDIFGSHVNLTSRLEGIIGSRPIRSHETEPIIITRTTSNYLEEEIALFPADLSVTNIKGFGYFAMKIREPICAQNHGISFSKLITDKQRDVLIHDHFFAIDAKQSVYGQFTERESYDDEIYIDYEIDLEEYERSRNVFLQLPLLASQHGRYGDAESWTNRYFMKRTGGAEIASTSGIVFDEPTSYVCAPCIDLKKKEIEGVFSTKNIVNNLIRVYLLQSNDGSDNFYVQPVDSRRWNRVYLGLTYIN